jgi:CHAT domain-containing protein/Tfp pilus assembly protein PilF
MEFLMCQITQIAVLIVGLGLVSNLPAEDQPREGSESAPSTRAEKLAECKQLANEALQLHSQRKFAEAIKIARRVIPMQEELFGADNKELISSWKFVAACEEQLESLSEAAAALDQAVSVGKSVYGADDWRTGDLRRESEKLALLQQLSKEDRSLLRETEKARDTIYELAGESKYAGATILAQTTLETRERLLGPEHPDTATSVFDLADTYDSQSKYTRAEPLYQQALTIREKTLEPDHPRTAECLNRLGLMAVHKRQYAVAVPLYLRALKIREKTLGSEDKAVATTLYNLGLAYKYQGNLAAAEPLYRRSLKIQEKIFGPEHSEVQSTLNSLGFLYMAQQNYALAEPLFQRSLEITEKVYGPEAEETATSVSNLGLVYKYEDKYAAAEPLYQRAIKIHEKLRGPEHLDVAIDINNLGELYRAEARYSAAEPLLRRSLQIREKVSAPDDPRIGTSLNNLALLLRTQGNFTAALPLLERAVKISEDALGPAHPDTAILIGSLADVQWRLNDMKSARSLAGQALDSQLEHLELTAAIQTEQQQFLMAAGLSRYLNTWLVVTRDDDADASETWRRVLAWKGATTTRQLGVRQALKDDPTYAEFRQTSQELSTLLLSPPQPPANSGAVAAWNRQAADLRRTWHEATERLEAKHQDLEKELSRKSALFHQEHRAVTPDAVIASLRQFSPSTALIDLIEYGYFGEKAKVEAGERHIAAFVVRADGKVDRVELGASRTIDKAVTAWRKTYGLAAGRRDVGHELRQLIWEPLEAKLGGVETVLVSPDGSLGQLPWGALPGAKTGTFLIEERAIAVIPVPHMLPELLSEKPPSGPPASMLLVGDVEYDADPGKPSELTPQLLADNRTRGGGLHFMKLANAEAEMSSIKESYQKVSAASATTLDLQSATEAAFQQQAPRHAWIHMITHGFFAPAELSKRLAGAAAQESSAEAAPATAPISAGIGSMLEFVEGHCVVTQLVAGGAAANDGRLKEGDVILAIAQAEGDWSEPVDLPTTIDMIRGPERTNVRLKIRPKAKPDGEVELTIQRASLSAGPTGRLTSFHPGLLSGLALAGANSPPESGRDNGILTALEVSAMDLSKVDTAVLSACETGLGEMAGGEGLLGLQRAFQVAGAKTVVASVWKVDDRTTRLLMSEFYSNLWDKKLGKLESLRQAQLKLLREGAKLKDGSDARGLTILSPQPLLDDGKLPPYYWAAFILSGDWR